ncbi:MAG: DMT family transporter [Coriobacteriia bacterium]|nr:DMT family transporter [Coriobacteriia bacterium]
MNKHAFGIAALFVATTGCGLSGLFARGASRVDLLGSQLIAGQSIGAVLTVGRLGTALVLFLVLAVATGKLCVFRVARPPIAVVAGGIMLGLALTLYQVAALLTSLANAVFLIYTGPLFCIMLACLLRHERLSVAQCFSVALVFAGMLLVSGIVDISQTGLSVGSFGSSGGQGTSVQGNILGLLAGIFYGGSLYCNGCDKDLDPIVRGSWNFLFALAGSALLALVLVGVWPLGTVNLQPVNVSYGIALCVVCGAVGCGALLVSARHLPTIEYTTLAYWECVVAAAASVIVFCEPLTMPLIIGGILIVVGGVAPVMLPHIMVMLPKTGKPSGAASAQGE